jgi:sarcosine dehydrogenase
LGSNEDQYEIKTDIVVNASGVWAPGQSLKIGGYETNPQFLRFETKSLSAFTLFDLNWDSFGINLENAIKLMPRLKNVGIQTTICGPESFTPDHKPLLGEDPKVRGFFHASGFNALGIFC